MRDFEVLFNPHNKVVFVRPLDGLVEKVWGEKFVYICSWEVCCKQLVLTVSACSKAGSNAAY